VIFSSSRKFIFFAVPKTGTHAVRAVLRPFLGDEDWEQQMLTAQMHSPITALANIGHGHISYQQLCQSIDATAIESYSRVAFVRHPIERFRSVCAFLARTDSSYSKDPLAWSKRAFQFERFRKRVLVRPQTDLLTDKDGQIAMSFIGRYESLDADLAQICSHLGVSAEPSKPQNVTPNEKPALYSDTAFVKELEAFYADDFRLLGYPRD
jgi:hypothetical protein